MLKAFFSFALDILFPKRCAGCQKEGVFLCENCKDAIRTIPPACFVCEKRSPDGTICPNCKPETAVRRFLAPLSFHDATARELIHAYKYHGAKEIAEALGEYIVSSLYTYQISPPPNSILVPIPLHPKRLRERGFNQAELVANVIGEKLGLAVETQILGRKVYRKQQTEMRHRKDRMENAKGVYRVKEPPPAESTLILIDDVATTGATLEEAAKVLKAAGAKQVWAFTAAR